MICTVDFTATNAATIKAELMHSVERTGEEVLSLENVTSLDITGIQLAFAWRKALVAQGRKATVKLPRAGNINDLLEKTGIHKLF
ncbi:MAG TPA: STAS domain-containing protein [Chryseosolibacter sp.]